MHNLIRGSRRARRLALSLIVALGLCSSFSSSAVAGSDTWDCYLAPADSCAGPYHTLTSSAAEDRTFTSRRVCAAAKFSSGSFNGSYFCAASVACHTYGGGSTTYPMTRNGTNATPPSSSFILRGYSTWGSTPAPSYCPAGSASRAAPSAAGAGAGNGLDAFATSTRSSAELPDQLAVQTRTAAGANARSFATPHGTAWVVSSVTDDRVCLAIPDVDGFGIACVTEEQAAAGLLSGELVSPSEDDPTSVFAVALPSGTKATLTRKNGEHVPLTVSSGVATGVVNGPAKLRVSGPDVDQTVTLNAAGSKNR